MYGTMPGALITAAGDVTRVCMTRHGGGPTLRVGGVPTKASDGTRARDRMRVVSGGEGPHLAGCRPAGVPTAAVATPFLILLISGLAEW